MKRVSLVILFFSFAFLASSAQAATKGPSGDAFYDAPSNLVTGAHGKLIWWGSPPNSVKVSTAAWTKNVLYVSKNYKGEKAEASGTVMIPKGKAPKGGFPLVVFAHGTTGIADICAPSAGDPSIAAYADYQELYKYFIKAKFAIALPDYEGLGTPGPHPYLLPSSTRASLDIVPAAKQLSKKISKKYALVGHSQGGQETIFSAKIAKNYLKKYKHVGTVAFAPASQLDTQAKNIAMLGSNPSSITALATLIVKSANLEAGATPENVLSPRIFDNSDAVLASGGKSLWDSADEVCLPALGARTAASGGLAPSALLTTNDWAGNADLQKVEPVLKSMNPAVRVPKKLLILQGGADTTVFPILTEILVNQLEELNPNRVEYLNNYPSATHSTIISSGAQKTRDTLKSWFRSR